MPHSQETQDATTRRLLRLNVELRLALLDARIVRARLLRAREANVWPALPSSRQLKASAPAEHD